MRTESSVVYWCGDQLYLNITHKCSNNCYFCFRNFSNGVYDFNLRLHSEPSPSEVIEGIQKAIIEKYWIEIVFCGFGEPTMRLDFVLIVTRWLKKNTNLIIRLNTNGHSFLLNKQRDTVMRLKDAGISKISISLNGHNEEIYKKICRPKLENAYESVPLFIKASSEVLDTEVTAVTIPKINLQIVEEKAHEFGASFRKREYLTPFP